MEQHAQCSYCGMDLTAESFDKLLDKKVDHILKNHGGKRMKDVRKNIRKDES